MKRRKYKYTPYKQGVYRPVNRNKFIGIKLPEYRSSWELKFFQWCDKNSNVLEWGSESVIVPYRSPVDGRMHRYYVDNVIALREGNTINKYLKRDFGDRMQRKLRAQGPRGKRKEGKRVENFKYDIVNNKLEKLDQKFH